MTTQIITGDCREVLATLPAGSVHAVVTDPPYGIGFMGKAWDHGVPGSPFWEAISATMKPGAHLLAFGGSRTFHRMATAIEDAGFQIRDVLSWLYGSGFPKSHNLTGDWQGWGTALKPGWEPIIMARKPFRGTVAANVLEHGTGAINVDGCRLAGDMSSANFGGKQAKGSGTFGQIVGNGYATQEHPAGRWPSNVVLDEDAAAILDEQSGERPSRAGATKGLMNIGCLAGIADTGPTPNPGTDYDRGYGSDTGGASRFFKIVAQGSFSTYNGVEEQECAACGEELTEAGNTSAGKRTASSADSLPTDGSGNRQTDLFQTDTKSITSTKTPSTTTSATSNVSPLSGTTTITSDSGKITESLTVSSSDGANAAASTNHSTDSSGASQEPIRATASPASVNTSESGEPETENTTTHTCANTGSLGAPSSRFFYVAKASRAERGEGNSHPTVKPVDLMRWLVRLVTPPGGTVLDPFMGSGTTGIAAFLEGFDFIGIEREEEYAAIARARIDHAMRQGRQVELEIA